MPELLLGDDPPPKRRSRWVDVGGLAAIVAAMVAIGVLGDRDDPEDRTRPTTTSTTEGADRPGTPTSSPLRQRVGPIFERPTETVLLLFDGEEGTLVDVDSGVLQPLELDQMGGIPHFGVHPAPGRFVLARPGGYRVIDAADGTGADVAFPGQRFGTQPPHAVGATDTAVWVRQAGGLQEVAFDGRPSGRQIEIPDTANTEAFLGDGVVLALHDTLTFVTFDGSTRSLGHGAFVAAGASTVAKWSCEVLACELLLLDVGTGAARPVQGLPAHGSHLFGARMSPDGRWLAATSAQPDGPMTLVDLHEARAGTLAGIFGVEAFAFAAEGDALFTLSPNGGLRVHDLRTGAWAWVDDIDTAGVRWLHTTRSR